MFVFPSTSRLFTFISWNKVVIAVSKSLANNSYICVISRCASFALRVVEIFLSPSISSNFGLHPGHFNYCSVRCWVLLQSSESVDFSVLAASWANFSPKSHMPSVGCDSKAISIFKNLAVEFGSFLCVHPTPFLSFSPCPSTAHGPPWDRVGIYSTV